MTTQIRRRDMVLDPLNRKHLVVGVERRADGTAKKISLLRHGKIVRVSRAEFEAGWRRAEEAANA
jgi:hypothetical protein